MAFLDVSDIVLDPDFCDSGIGLERAVQSVGLDGLAVDTITASTIVGVVCAADGQRMHRTADGERASDVITLHTPTRLTGGDIPNTPADVITWEGVRYTVTTVNSYSHFGRGFVAATCEVIPVAGG